LLLIISGVILWIYLRKRHRATTPWLMIRWETSTNTFCNAKKFSSFKTTSEAGFVAIWLLSIVSFVHFVQTFFPKGYEKRRLGLKFALILGR
jgi:uncharacterized membrane protein